MIANNIYGIILKCGVYVLIQYYTMYKYEYNIRTCVTSSKLILKYCILFIIYSTASTSFILYYIHLILYLQICTTVSLNLFHFQTIIINIMAYSEYLFIVVSHRGDSLFRAVATIQA